MATILNFNASNSRTSINAQLLAHIQTHLADTHTVVSHHAGEFDLPFYSSDREQAGFPDELARFFALIDDSDAIIIATPEHNGSVPAQFKNLFDWATRFDRGDNKIFAGKPVLVLSTSPGKQGAINANNWLAGMLGYYNGKLVEQVAIGGFFEHFSDGQFDAETASILNHAADKLLSAL